MKLTLELVDGTNHTFTPEQGLAQTFRAVINRAIQDHGFLNSTEFFPLDNVKRVTVAT